MDKKQLKKEWKKNHEELQVLLNEFDILGVMPDWPKDEYDCLNGPILGMLQRKSGEEKIKDFLSYEITNIFGMEIHRDEISKFVNKVIDWWNN